MLIFLSTGVWIKSKVINILSTGNYGFKLSSTKAYKKLSTYPQPLLLLLYLYSLFVFFLVKTKKSKPVDNFIHRAKIGGKIMKFFCDKNVLNGKISIVQKAISNRTTMPSLQGILIKAKDEKITMIGSDLDLTIETEFSSNIEEEGTILVESRLFGDIIRKLPNETVKIENKDNLIQITCKRATFNLVCLNKDDYPTLTTISSADSFKICECILKDIIRNTIFSVSQEETRPVLTGILFDINEEHLNSIALDGYRLAFSSENIKSNFSIKEIIPGKTLTELNKLLTDCEEVVEMSFDRNHVLFKTKDIKVMSRLLEGDFVEYNNIIPKEFEIIFSINKNEIQECIERASLVTRDGDSNTSLVIFNIKNNSLEIKSESKLGNFSEELDIKNIKGSSLRTAFNAKYLLDVFKVMDSEDITMNFNTAVTPCIIKKLDDESNIYLILPVKISA